MPLNNFGLVHLGIYRSAQLDQDSILFLRSNLGVSRVIKLNTDDPLEANWCKQNFISLDQFPIPTFINQAQPIMTIADWIAECSKKEKLVVHCLHGRDRTGLVIAAYRIRHQGWSVQQADEERKVYGVEGVIKFGDDEIGNMETVLNEIYKMRSEPNA